MEQAQGTWLEIDTNKPANSFFCSLIISLTFFFLEENLKKHVFKALLKNKVFQDANPKLTECHKFCLLPCSYLFAHHSSK